MVVEAIKERMNDPDSFEHVETRYGEDESTGTIRIRTKFRGKNAFGGTITQSVYAWVTKDGKLADMAEPVDG